MKILNRLVYYFLGFSFGLIILFFVLSGKKTSCNYGPEARVKKELLKKKVVFSVAELTVKQFTLNDSFIYQLIEKGDVLFSESNTQRDSCNSYAIAVEEQDKKIRLDVENCKETIRLVSFSKQ